MNMDENTEEIYEKMTRLHGLLLTIFTVLAGSYALSLMFTLYNNPLKMMARCLQAQVTMALPHVEARNIQVDPTVAVTRNHISIDESGFESIVQLTFQWGVYFAFANAVHVIGDQGQIPASVRDNFNFSQKYLPWVSAASGLLSLTLHQYKSIGTQHEFSMSGMQKAFLFLACVFNTLSYASVFVTFATCTLDVLFYAQVDINVWIFISVGAVLFPILVVFTNTSEKWFMPRGLESDDRIPVPREGYNTQAWYRKVADAITNPVLINVASMMELPMGRHRIFFRQKDPPSHTSYITYNSIKSATVYVGFLRQSVAYVIMTSLTLLLFCVNTYFFGLDVSQVPSRWYFHVISMAMIPGGYIFSYVFTWLYILQDNGFLTGTDLRWLNGKPKQEGLIRQQASWLNGKPNQEGDSQHTLQIEENQQQQKEMDSSCSCSCNCWGRGCDVLQDFSSRGQCVTKPLTLEGFWDDLNCIENIEEESQQREYGVISDRKCGLCILVCS